MYDACPSSATYGDGTYGTITTNVYTNPKHILPSDECPDAEEILYLNSYCAKSVDANCDGTTCTEVGRQWNIASLKDCKFLCRDNENCNYISYTESSSGDCLMYDACPSSATYGDGTYGTITTNVGTSGTITTNGCTNQCTDTEGWTNNHGFTCADYASNNWCANGAFVAGNEWTGDEYNYPGRNCMSCGKTCTPAKHVVGQNVVEHNAPGVGGWGGLCTCPDGGVYRVGDNGDSCGSLACHGGISGTCHKDHDDNRLKVTCAPAVDVPTHNYVVSGLNQFCPFGTSVINDQRECFNAYSLLKHSQGWTRCTSGYCENSGTWSDVAQCGVQMSDDTSATNGNHEIHFKTNNRDDSNPNERWVRICKTNVRYLGCYRNKGHNRVGGHIDDRTVDECARIATSGFFGMEHPQPASQPNEAQCLPLPGLPSMTKIADYECGAQKVDSAGRRLGGFDILAVYRRN